MQHRKKRSRRGLVAAGLAATLLLGGCGAAATPGGAEPAPSPAPGPGASTGQNPIGQTIAGRLNPTGPGYAVTLDPSVITGQELFGIKLYQALLAEQQSGENVFVSPLSVALALAMTYNGADGDTQEAMAAVLEAAGIDRDTFNGSYYELIKVLQKDEADIQLRIANGIWQHEGTEFLADFLKRNKQFYDAAIESLDMRDPASVDVINGWVKEQTADRIPEIVSELDPNTVMMLINAIYFKGDWRQPFDPGQTAPGQFHLNDGTTLEVPMMQQYGDFAHYRGEGFQAVRIPYGAEGDLAMYVFLPDENSDLAAFHQALTPDNWAQWLAGFHSNEGSLSLPRFELEFESSLKQALRSLGMEVAFDPGAADFGGMQAVGPERNLYIGDVVHRTFLLVNEVGSEAAAVTGVDMHVTSVGPEPFNFVADRPFFVAIRDDYTGALLFAGSVVAPEPAEAP